jgi:hypothetical protein
MRERKFCVYFPFVLLYSIALSPLHPDYVILVWSTIISSDKYLLNESAYYAALDSLNSVHG